ncbi:MAG: HD domain-containing phosphohydrolase [Desulfatibacillaceae bacterium]
MAKKSPEILIVEDSPTQTLQLKLLLEDADYDVLAAEDGKQGLEMAREHRPDLIISDVNMPVMNGFEMCEAIKEDEDLRGIPLIMLTTLSDPADIVRGLEAMADSYVTKPYSEDFLLGKVRYLLDYPPSADGPSKGEPLEFHYQDKKFLLKSSRLQMVNVLLSTYEDSVEKNRELVRTQEALEELTDKLEHKVRERTKELQAEIMEREGKEIALTETVEKLYRAMEQIITAMGSTMEVRDPYTSDHQRRVAKLAAALADELGLTEDQSEGIRMAGLIHDLGKIAIPLDILNKPGRISEIEFSLIKTHPRVGYDILKSVEFPWPVADIVLQHHERLDGSGYPLGLTGAAITLETRILSVADVVEAISSHRPYRPALGIEVAMEEISRKRGVHFDSEVVDACVSLIRDKGFSLE